MGKNCILFAFISYLISFIVYLFMPDGVRSIHWHPGELHVHHFVYGIAIMVIGYPFGPFLKSERAKLIYFLLYGFGLFLLIDEIHMWLWLDPNGYKLSSRQLPSLIVVGIFLIILLFQKLFSKPQKQNP